MPGDASLTPTRSTVSLRAPVEACPVVLPAPPDQAGARSTHRRRRRRPPRRAPPPLGRGIGGPGRRPRPVGDGPGLPGPRGPAGLVRARGRGGGDPLGQDGGLPRGLPLLRPVVPLRDAGEGHPLPGHHRGPERRRPRRRRPEPRSSVSSSPSGAPTRGPSTGSSSSSPWSRSPPG